MSQLEAEFAEVFAGRPADLEERSRRLEETAAAIEDAAAALRDLVEAQRSLATDAAEVSAEEAAAGMRRARTRYAGTAAALIAFAVELEPLQTRGRAAVAEAEEQQGRLSTLEADVIDLQSQVNVASSSGEPTSALEGDLLHAMQSRTAAETAIEEARRTLYRTREEIWEAAGRAAAQIKTASEAGADSFGDDWNQFWGTVGAMLDLVGAWAERVLAPVLHVLGERLSALVSAVIVAVLIAVAVGLVALMFVAWGAIGLLIVGAVAALGLLGLVIAEQAGKPQLVGVDAATTSGGDPESPLVEADEARNYEQILRQLGIQDRQGQGEVTQIRVVAVRDAAGEVVSWRVQLPSTQEWSPTNTDGALNDLRTDLMLSMFPEIETQYEQAAWAAMEAAGVFDSDAPIMFTGWSLGGMMAGDMATDLRVEGRVGAVFTAGAAIDKHYGDIPEGVRVTQINNGFDPVHTFEFVGLEVSDSVRSGGDWETHRPLAGPIHDVNMYRAEAARHVPVPRPGDEIFFAAAGPDSYEDVYIAEYTRGS